VADGAARRAGTTLYVNASRFPRQHRRPRAHPAPRPDASCTHPVLRWCRVQSETDGVPRPYFTVAAVVERDRENNLRYSSSITISLSLFHSLSLSLSLSLAPLAAVVRDLPENVNTALEGHLTCPRVESSEKENRDDDSKSCPGNRLRRRHV